MVDRLASLMTHFPVGAQVFNTGPLCGLNTLESDGAHGQLHLVRSGAVEVRYERKSIQIERPSLLLFPRPLTHRFVTDPQRGADMVCANLSFEGAQAIRSHRRCRMSSACRWTPLQVPSRYCRCCSRRPSGNDAVVSH